MSSKKLKESVESDILNYMPDLGYGDLEAFIEKTEAFDANVGKIIKYLSKELGYSLDDIEEDPNLYMYGLWMDSLGRAINKANANDVEDIWDKFGFSTNYLDSDIWVQGGEMLYDFDELVKAVKEIKDKEGISESRSNRKRKLKEDDEVLDLEFNSDDIGDVEVEKVLDKSNIPLEHADEPIEMLDVFVVNNPEISQDEFHTVVDVSDNDADTGITVAVLVENNEESELVVDHEATKEVVQTIIDKLANNGHEVVNINSVGIDANDTVGDELLDEDDLNKPVEGGFEVVTNLDSSVTILGDPDVLMDVIYGDAIDDVIAELNEMPLVDDVMEVTVESKIRKLKRDNIKESSRLNKRKLSEATEDEYVNVMSDFFDVPKEDVSCEIEDDYNIEYARVEFDNEEYIVFESQGDAYEYAVGRMEQEIEDEPYLFNFNSIQYFIEKDYFDDLQRGSIEGAVNDYSYSDKIDELLSYGIISDDDAEDEDFDPDFYDYELIDAIMSTLGDSLDYVVDNFGEDFVMEEFKQNPYNLVNTKELAEYVIDNDGENHIITSYGGDRIDLENGMVAYRTN